MRKRIQAMLLVLLVMTVMLTGCGEKKTGEYFHYVVKKTDDGKYIQIMELTDLGKEQEYIIIPSEIDGIKVEKLGGAYYHGAWESEKLRKVYVASYEEIFSGDNFFEQCQGLEKIILLFVPTVGGYESPGYNYSLNLQQTIDSSICGRANISFRYNYTDAPNDGFYWIDDLDDELITYIPPAPERKGYMFGGWYKESECINAWNFATDKIPPKVWDETGLLEYQETNLYAQWIAA